MDETTEVSSQSWFGRIGESIKGVAFGFVLIIISVVLMCWNEGRSVTTVRSLKEGAHVVVPVSPQKVDPANEGKLVQLAGDATNSEAVTDPTFMVSSPNALRLTRDVEMFQWKEDKKTETQKQLGGSSQTVTTYSYSKVWSPTLIESNGFKNRQGHENPSAMVAQGNTVFATHATIGAFKLPQSLLAKIHVDTPLNATDADLQKLPADMKAKAKLSGGGFFLGNDPATPDIGDQKITFKMVQPGTFSVLARQIGDTFEPYLAKAGGSIERIESGTVSADQMIKHAEGENATITWLVRLGGFILMSLGIGMMISPVVVFADVIPFLGNILGAGVFMAAVGLGLFGSLIVIGLAWLVVRPILGVTLLACAVGALVLAFQHGRKRLAAKRAG